MKREGGKNNLGSWVQRRKCQIHIRGLRLGDLGQTHGLCIRVNDNMFPHLAINSVLSLAIHCQQELCQISQMNFLRPLHLFPLHLLPPSPPLICFPFPTLCQVHTCKGHQRLYYCHIRWPLSFYPTGHLQGARHSLLKVLYLVFHGTFLTIFFLASFGFFFLVFSPSNICAYYLTLKVYPSDLFST